MSWQQLEKAEIKADEGLRLKAYKDSNGIWTIGYGHTTDEVAVGQGKTITQQEADDLFELDFEEAVTAAKEVVPFFDALDGPRKGAMVNLAFNMGAKTLSGFHGTLEALDNQEWELAATNLMNSRYARQTKGRAVRIAYRLRTGQYAVRT